MAASRRGELIKPAPDSAHRRVSPAVDLPGLNKSTPASNPSGGTPDRIEFAARIKRAAQFDIRVFFSTNGADFPLPWDRKCFQSLLGAGGLTRCHFANDIEGYWRTSNRHRMENGTPGTVKLSVARRQRWGR